MQYCPVKVGLCHYWQKLKQVSFISRTEKTGLNCMYCSDALDFVPGPLLTYAGVVVAQTK